jgi:diguanylate cyclase (GGDEF)-like protein
MIKAIKRPPYYLPLLCGVIVFVLASLIALFTYYSVSNQNRIDIMANATNQGGLVIKLTQGFVRAYSDFEAQYASGLLPNPAIYRTHALNLTDLNSLFGGSLSSEVIGFPNKSIKREPTDELMKRQMLTLQASSERNMKLSTFEQDGKTIQRALWPFYATDKTCINCHNAMQNLTGDEQWKLGDLMGAQIVEKNIGPELKKAHHETLLLSILMFFGVIAVLYCFIFLFRQVFLSRELKKLASTDAMTGCINRREIYDRVAKLKVNVSGAILMLDIDKFKSINDNYGHPAGDEVIRLFSEKIHLLMRRKDWVARMGGEEFLIWLSDVTPEQALNTAERLRKETELSCLTWHEKHIQYTVSIGLYVFHDESPTHFDSWVNSADKKLYQAKNQGRNRVVS